MADPALRFGTAGIRGLMGEGPGRMNRDTIGRVTHGLVEYLLETVPDARERGIVIARDGRKLSDVFQLDAALIAGGFSLPVYFLGGPRPTPLLAFAVTRLGAAAGVMITASHNPPDYNGYKVYWENGAQIIPPIDEGISAAIDRAPDPSEMPRAETQIELELELELEEAYLEAVSSLALVPAAHDVRVAYSAMHGCGQPLLLKALARHGIEDVHPVPEQAEPDGEFPTLPFPNPEEPGAMDRLLTLAAEKDCDVALANDPDADRLGAAVKRGPGDYVVLTGNEIGILLAHHVLEHTRVEAPLVVSTLVSSRMLETMARARGVRYLDTLTGFKWITNEAMRVEREENVRFVFGYEEALGYTVGTVVRDKDGISAALLLAEMAAVWKAEGKTLLDALETLRARYGHFVTGQRSLTDVSTETVMARLRSWREPTRQIADVFIYDLDDGARLCVRPSGTEPKLKLYCEAVAEEAKAARTRLDALEEEVLKKALQDGVDKA